MFEEEVEKDKDELKRLDINKQHWIGEKKSREQKLMGRPETWLLTFISKMVLDDDIPYNKK